MNTLIDQNLPANGKQVLNSLNGSAANDDHLPGLASANHASTTATGGWDAHDVWRRLIKEARARRQGADQLRQW